MLPQLEAIPPPLRASEHLLVWGEITDKKGRKRKTPVSKSGNAIGYNNPAAIMSFEDVKSRLEKDDGIGFGISLLGGLNLETDEESGYLYSLDFDGFADFESTDIDDGILEFLKLFPGYCEMSPSGTGFKFFFISNRLPEPKFKIKFSPSAFAAKHPDVKKYQDREVEVFSKGCFLALTGDLFNSGTAKLHFIENSKVNEMFTYLDDWAKRTGGSGLKIQESKSSRKTSESETTYHKLTVPGLELVLKYIDHFDEEIWSDTANALARAYDEEGRVFFLKYSEGVYCGEPYPYFDEDESNERFERALRDLSSRPDGYGIKHLISLAQKHRDWPNTALEYEGGLSSDSPVWGDLDPETLFSDTAKSDSDENQHPAVSAQKPNPSNPYSLLSPQELKNRPQPNWLVKGILPGTGIASCFGPPMSAKTFMAMDLGGAVALGKPFFGYKTTQCPVVYIALEGGAGLANRIKAYEQVNNVKLPPNHFRIVLDKFQLRKADVEALAQAVAQEGCDNGLIIIDTLAQAALGADENSSVDMGRLIAAAQLLQKMTNSLVFLVHHTGKDIRRGQRGHSSLLAALDASIELKDTANGRSWKSTKVKDGAAGVEVNFDLKVVNLGTDEDGDPITSCVAVGDLFRVNAPTPPQGKNQIAVYNALVSKYQKGSVLSKEDITSVAEGALASNLKFRTRAKHALSGLIDKRLLIENGDNYTIA